MWVWACMLECVCVRSSGIWETCWLTDWQRLRHASDSAQQLERETAFIWRRGGGGLNGKSRAPHLPGPHLLPTLVFRAWCPGAVCSALWREMLISPSKQHPTAHSGVPRLRPPSLLSRLNPVNYAAACQRRASNHFITPGSRTSRSPADKDDRS